ncbi:MAG: FHA domain-containing protein [Gammaproteobacteria bacterium]
MEPATRDCAVLIVDVADSTSLRTRIGEAAAEQRIRQLLNNIIATSKSRRGEFIKSYGDDVLAVFEGQAVAAAADTAIAAQRLAASAGLELYAGLHQGPVEFRETMGHPDAVGLTVSVAARLHKLTGAPGRIFMAEEWVAALTPALRERAKLYGPRELKGVGMVNVWTLDWRDSTLETQVVPSAAVAPPPVSLMLRHGDKSVRLVEMRSYAIGRGPESTLCVPDPEPRVSTVHLKIEHSAMGWFVEDISRNGTGRRDGTPGAGRQRPHISRVMLPRAGDLCLGRPFADDRKRQFTVGFSATDA